MPVEFLPYTICDVCVILQFLLGRGLHTVQWAGLLIYDERGHIERCFGPGFVMGQRKHEATEPVSGPVKPVT